MDGSSEGPKGPKPFRFKGTPAAKVRHNFAVVALLASVGIAFLMEISPGMKNTYRTYENFDKRFEDTFEDHMKREQLNFGVAPVYTRDGGVVRAKKKYEETHDDDPIFIA